jgi:hypothetical protein|uniref:Uncharacterized protein n=1 Tax=viral metagenome TaxID=1070528 RepID=A0A6C0BLL6_9ZZZZ
MVIALAITYWKWSRSQTETFATSELSPYVNFNLTDRPVANYAPYDLYKWWKYGDLHKHEIAKHRNCDQYRCTTDQLNGATTPAGFNLVNKYTNPGNDLLKVKLSPSDAERQCAYYENSQRYCALHPGDTRCPDYWKYKSPAC